MNDSLADALTGVTAYHQATKHYFHRYAASLGYMDWENQPDPFRLYEGTERIQLPFISRDGDAAHEDLYNRRNNPSQPLNIDTIGAFFELSMGLSAWKSQAGEQWALRINPSSGNLHPTEAHVVLPPLENRAAGVFHYSPLLHALERRATIKDETWDGIPRHFGGPGFLVGLTSIFWREEWKYGERAYRYCNHDAGHALAALSFSANLLGWKVLYLNSLADHDIETILGLEKTKWHKLEEEHPDMLCFVFPHSREVKDVPRGLPEPVIRSFEDLEFKGTPNRLSAVKMDWKIIPATARYARKERTAPEHIPLEAGESGYHTGSSFKAAQILRKRRSGADYDSSRSHISKEQFLSMLDRTLPRRHTAPFDIELQVPRIHLLLFVHRVTGLEPGLYILVRNMDDLDSLKSSFHYHFSWDRAIAEGFPLFLLEKGDYRGCAARLSCEQEIAGDGAFSLGMLANFPDSLRQRPYGYRHLFWETGMVGQVLYLEAEANGISGTGIGCFFDDEVHDIAGIQDTRFQSLYHFTVGTAAVDHRLTTLPPYFHLRHKK
jgi:SagB-type dehydrogenase family enzyme